MIQTWDADIVVRIKAVNTLKAEWLLTSNKIAVVDRLSGQSLFEMKYLPQDK